jgi:hypothetical protein
MCADLEQPEVADSQQSGNSKGHVMDVPAAGGYVLEWSAFGTDRVGNGPDRRECHEEGARRKELPLLPVIAEVLVVDGLKILKPRALSRRLQRAFVSTFVADHRR